MKKLQLADSNLNVTQFALGCMQFGGRASRAESAALIDCYRDAGGAFFDTAHCYCFWEDGGDGRSERILGKYLRENECRDDVVVATKGGHPAVPGYRRHDEYLTPCRVAADIDDSLGRMQIDHIDLYWLHRDDPRVDVGAILDILNNEVRRGRIRCFGGSNWTSQRLAEANRYAAEHGIDGFVASQPRWSLLEYDAMSQAERLEPGVLLHLDAADRAWHRDSQVPVVPYGPTGKGFFATGGDAAERFRNRENLARAERTQALADELGSTANQVALAWLLHQPFPVVPILGTSQVPHLEDALGAANVSLTPAQVAWLERGEQ